MQFPTRLQLLISLVICLWLYPARGWAQITSPAMSPQCNVFTFDGSESADPDNEKINFSWDFGDGSSAVGPVVEHRYEKSGKYNVALKITDNSGAECAEDSISREVVVNIPPYVEFSSPSRVCAGMPVKLDAGNSRDDEGRPLSYQWNFGDGTHLTTRKAVAEKTYKTGGTFEISLSVDDNLNSICNTASTSRMIYVNSPPRIDAGPKQRYQCVQRESDLTVAFDASDTHDINADNLQFTWDMGDGRTQTGPKVAHTYPGHGTYDVKLLVDDKSGLECAQDVEFYQVKLSQAPQADAGPDAFGCVGQKLDFDGRNSGAQLKGTLHGRWDYGDGQFEEGIKTAYAYQRPGTYQAVLTVTDKMNDMCPPSKDTKRVVINAAPQVSITAQKTGCVGEKIELRATSAMDPDGDDLEYYWTFGDGTVVKGPSMVSHQYGQGGEFRVTVIVDDGRGTACSTASAEARVMVNTPPVADAGPNLTCCVGESAEFNATASSDADDDPLLYTWSFGDGTSQEGARVNHRYDKSGSYTVLLTVDDNSQTHCSTATASFVAEVNAKPTATFQIR